MMYDESSVGDQVQLSSDRKKDSIVLYILSLSVQYVLRSAVRIGRRFNDVCLWKEGLCFIVNKETLDLGEQIK